MLIQKIISHINKFRSNTREIYKENARSSQWGKTRDDFLEKNPICSACNSQNNLQVHHIVPFHIDPTKELDENNLITLCMDLYDCHLNIGHGDSFSCYNPNVVDDCKKFAISNEKIRQQILLEAKKNRKKN